VFDCALTPRAAFDGQLGFASAAGPAGVTVQPRDDLALAIVMAGKGRAAEVADAVRTLYRIELPSGPRRVAAGPLAFIGVAPGQWVAVEQGGNPLTFAARLTEALAGIASVSDQSDSRAVLRLAGPRARDVLAKGLALDLHPRVFGPGDAALSVIALIGAHLWQIDDAPTYEIAVFRSMAGSFAEFIRVSAAEYGVALIP
jgi:sarcosine oxidase subunit gamma